MSAAGATWFAVGHAFVVSERRLVAVGIGFAELLEATLRLVVNTVSFVRVGAFALAHSGLSLAVVGLAAATDSLTSSVLVLVLGNVVIKNIYNIVYVYIDRFDRSKSRDVADEIAQFNLGSTVIVLLPPGAVTWDPRLPIQRSLLTGQSLGRIHGAAADT